MKSSQEWAMIAAEAAADKKGEDIVAIEVADLLVVDLVVGHAEEELPKIVKSRPIGATESRPNGASKRLKISWKT